jgi:hypothetical protein
MINVIVDAQLLSVIDRSQAVDADTQKAMMAFYYKKQEEQKVWHAICCARMWTR